MCSPIRPASVDRARRVPAGRTRARCNCCSNSRWMTSSTGCGRRCSSPTSKRVSDLRTRATGYATIPALAYPVALDRRRSFKEMVKRRGAPGATQSFIDEDLRFRQLTRRRQPAIHAVVFFMLDVSGSMSDRDRKLAKTFFFWVVQGLRREYRSLETVFVAHTTEAWEFNEPDFFQVSGTGGTLASCGLAKVREIIDGRYNPGRRNVYLFYASDGDNSVSDAADARGALGAIAADACFTGYVEVSSGLSRQLATETGKLFAELQSAGCAAGSYALNDFEDVWGAVRHFFTAESSAPE